MQLNLITYNTAISSLVRQNTAHVHSKHQRDHVILGVVDRDVEVVTRVPTPTGTGILYLCLFMPIHSI